MAALRLATAHDAAAIAAIYAPYVLSSPISFEAEPPDEAAMRSRIEAGGGLHPWLVALDEAGDIVGYAYACAFRPRVAYRFAVETSVYVAEGAHGRGIGDELYGALLPMLEAQGFTQAIAAITLPNPASVRLHEKHGFIESGVYRDVGYKLGRWLSVSLWQRALAPLTERPAEPKPVAAVWSASPNLRPSGQGLIRTG
jgi:phosphinothricin acetyltransferase